MTTDQKAFLEYISNARREFVAKILETAPSTAMRVIAEDLLIAYDQLRDRYEQTLQMPDNRIWCIEQVDDGWKFSRPLGAYHKMELLPDPEIVKEPILKYECDQNLKPHDQH